MEGWFASLGAERVRVSFDAVRITAEKDFAVVSAVVSYTALSAEGQELRAMQSRISWALKTSGPVLRIVHEHTSAPIGFEDSKAVLRRDAKA